MASEELRNPRTETLAPNDPTDPTTDAPMGLFACLGSEPEVGASLGASDFGWL